MRRLLSLILLTVLPFCHGEETPSGLQQVLFIGNSYTAQSREALQELLAASPYTGTSFTFFTKGGATLERHLNNPDVLEKLQSQRWDVVVLQEQSQTPGLPREPKESFQRSVDAFTTLLREAGAEPILFMTWGRRDGDKRNPQFYPDFETMNRMLSEAYRTAAERNHLRVAAVGDAWAIVRETDSELGTALYRKDGSHPSRKGALLAAAVVMQTLFPDSLDSLPVPEDISTEDWNIITHAAEKASATDSAPEAANP